MAGEIVIHLDTSHVMAFAATLASNAAEAKEKATLAVQKTAYDIQADAQAAAPVDTGFLQGSISTTVSGTSAEVGPTAHYGGFVELGTSRMAPQPYLFPAFERRVPQLEIALGSIGGFL